MSQQNDTDLFGNQIVSEKNNVYLNKGKQKKEQKDLSGKIQTEFILEIVCKDAIEQEKMYELLINKGFICRVLTL